MTNSSAAIDLPTHSKPRKKTKTWRSKAQWKALLDEFPTSGLTKSAFCKKHQISTGSLHKWQNYFDDQSPAAEFINITKPIAKATSVQPAPKTDSHWQVELDLGAGVVLRVRAS